MTNTEMTKNTAFRSCEKYTQAEFAEWLERIPSGDLYHYELLDGFIVCEPPAGWPHGEIEVLITNRLGPFVRSGRCGRVFGSSQGYDLPTGDTVEPDVSFVSTEGWRSLETPIRGFIKVAPDLVFEVLSPSTKRIDQREKKRVYARNRVTEFVLVDPKSKTVTRFRYTGKGYDAGRKLGVEAMFESSVVPGFAMPVREMFPED